MLSVDLESSMWKEKQKLKFQTTDSWNGSWESGVNSSEQNTFLKFLHILKAPWPPSPPQLAYGHPQTHGQDFSPALPSLQAMKSSHKSNLKDILKSLHVNSSVKQMF